MSTFLQLAAETRRECQMSGTGPSTVLAQTGRLGDVVAWVANAYTEIQAKHTDWRWLRAPFTFNTVADTDTYAYTACTDTLTSATITRFAAWLPNDTDGTPVFKRYLTSGGVGNQSFLIFLPWGEFRYLYKTGSQTNQQPIHFTIDPQNNLVLGPQPDAIYTITGDYERSAQVLAADSDTPEMPSRFHQLIVYEAMKKYAGSTAAPEVMFRATGEGRRLWRALERDQLPKISRARPLA